MGVPIAPESVKAIRKCKACLQPIKGHQGPYGLVKCKNVNENKENVAKLDEKVVSEHDIGDLTAALESVAVNSDLSNANENNTTKGSRPRNKIEEAVVNEKDEPVMTTGAPCSQDFGSKATQECDSNDNSLLSNGEEFSLKIDDIVAKLQLMENENEEWNFSTCFSPILLDNPDVNDTTDKPVEKSTDIDIRSILSGGHFCICQCPPTSEVSECHCEGELTLDKSLSGQIRNVFMDPSTVSQVDWAPHVKFLEERWSKDNPAVIVLVMESVGVRGVKVVDGEVVIEAALEMEGDEVHGVVKGSMSLSVQVSKKYLTKGLKNPIRFRPSMFQLVNLEDE